MFQQLDKINIDDVRADIEMITTETYDLGYDLEDWLADHYNDDGSPKSREELEALEEEASETYDIIFIEQVANVIRSLNRRRDNL